MFLFLLRICIFVFSYAGIEHDSGWYLGVAKNLAEKGIYVSYTNPIPSPEPGVQNSIWGRPVVQDENGFTYFQAGVTVGPGYIIPEAFFLRIFGNGWWQYRLWPLISFAMLLYLIFSSVHKLGGLVSLCFCMVWFWLLPSIYIGFAFESFSEHTALLYYMISFIVFSESIYLRSRGALLGSFLAGIFMAFSIETKILFLLALPSIPLVLAYYFLYPGWHNRKEVAFILFCFFAGVIIPIGLFEMYKYMTLNSLFGHEAWRAANEDFLIHFSNAGSGIDVARHMGVTMNNVLLKLTLFTHVGLGEYGTNLVLIIMPWLLIFFSGVFAVKTIRKNGSPFLALMCATFLGFSAWFLLLSASNWVRHAWAALIIGMMLLSILPGFLLHLKNRILRSALIVGFLVIIAVSLNYAKLDPAFFLPEERINVWHNQRFASPLQGLPSNPIFSLADQNDILEYIHKNVKAKDRIYFKDGFLVAEMATLADKVFYPSGRFVRFNRSNPEGGLSYLIIGPYQRGKFRIVDQDCSDVVFENESYKLCLHP